MTESPFDCLTPAERRVLAMVADGMSIPEIAKALCRSPKTIGNQRYSIGDKLGVSNRVLLARMVWEHGLGACDDVMGRTVREDEESGQEKQFAAGSEVEGS